MPTALRPTARVLLRRQSLVAVPGGPAAQPEAVLRALDAELAALGYAPSHRLRARLATLPAPALAEWRAAVVADLAEAKGANYRHEPLFRRFPDDVPADTEALWWQRFLVHFLQAPDQPCLTCGALGTTHVLRPCRHVVCDRCFDGANYAGCPICNQKVDRDAPFFLPTDVDRTTLGAERPTFRRLDLVEDPEAAGRALFEALCARSQAMSPGDRDDLAALVADHPVEALAWAPAEIPVREHVALLYGGVARAGDPAAALAAALPRWNSATDVLRFVAAWSGADPALQGTTTVSRGQDGARVARTTYRFGVVKLPRTTRRALLAWLDARPAAGLIEDMRRHRAYWVWLGRFLHPHEYAARFPNVAAAFADVRRRAPDGTRAPRFRTWAGRVEAALRAPDPEALVPLLAARPGELGRRLDHALRRLADAPAAQARVADLFVERLGGMATPMLLTLGAQLATRHRPAPVRVYWPKGASAVGVSAPDHRAPLDPALTGRLVAAIEAELLRRLAARPPLEDAIVDPRLRRVPVPFNERTAARGAVALPRGARVPVPAGATMRLFLHWCEPARGGSRTDLDLSVAFYDAAWTYVGVCSYYQLQFVGAGGAIARSAGDLTSAPHPDGATEFVDVDLAVAGAEGVRYAVAVVNAYAGMTFDALERAFAGLMVRHDPRSAHFDPRTVALRFALQGQHGVYAPLVFDVAARELHWLDLHARGQFELNNVETSRPDLRRIGADLLAYFGSGVRPTMWDLALLNVAARAERVYVHGGGVVARDGEEPAAFLARLRAAAEGAPAAADAPGAGGRRVWAALFEGDRALPEGAEAYCLLPGQVTGTLAAADLLG